MHLGRVVGVADAALKCSQTSFPVTTDVGKARDRVRGLYLQFDFDTERVIAEGTVEDSLELCLWLGDYNFS